MQRQTAFELLYYQLGQLAREIIQKYKQINPKYDFCKVKHA